MAMSYAGFTSFRLRQYTGIPFTKICEVASDIAYRTLLEDSELREEVIRLYAIRSPEKQLEMDLKKGYEKVTP